MEAIVMFFGLIAAFSIFALAAVDPRRRLARHRSRDDYRI